MKKYRFFFHYNKPASKKRGIPVLSIHWKKKCILVNQIFCSTKIESRVNKKQPHCVMQGFAGSVRVFDHIGNRNLTAFID